MPNGLQTGPARPQIEPQPAHPPGSEREQRKELQSWWKHFRHRAARKDDEKGRRSTLFDEPRVSRRRVGARAPFRLVCAPRATPSD
ncbi:MAG: hypothetical protein INR71_10440 [Terriglobus roseus]|nr:hypothetical protein [Terriglobus roseus]